MPTAVSPIAPLASQGLLQACFEDLRADEHHATDRKLAFIGQTILDHTGVEAGTPVAAGTWSSREYQACSCAEGFFIDCLRQLTGFGYHNQPVVSVYHRGEVPILFRKNQDSATALTLQPVQLGPLSVPAGTIVAVPSTMNRDKTGERLTRTTQLSTYQLPNSLQLAVARLTPWAYRTPDQQLLYAVDAFKENLKIDRERRTIIETADLDTFRAAAVSLGRKCGIKLGGSSLEDIATMKRALLSLRFKQIALFRLVTDMQGLLTD